jgi:hypothetical protein
MKTKNEYLEIFSCAGLNRKLELVELCKKEGRNDATQIIVEFKKIQVEIFNHLWTITEPDSRLSQTEIEKEVENYCNKYFYWINKKGTKAITDWILWMCWHEGLFNIKKND